MFIDLLEIGADVSVDSVEADPIVADAVVGSD